MTMSLIVPGALEIKAAAQNAPKKRVTKIASIFWAKAHGRTRMTKRDKATMYTILLPYISDKGARMTDPTAIPMRYVVSPRLLPRFSARLRGGCLLLDLPCCF